MCRPRQHIIQTENTQSLRYTLSVGIIGAITAISDTAETPLKACFYLLKDAFDEAEQAAALVPRAAIAQVLEPARVHGVQVVRQADGLHQRRRLHRRQVADGRYPLRGDAG